MYIHPLHSLSSFAKRFFQKSNFLKYLVCFHEGFRENDRGGVLLLSILVLSRYVLLITTCVGGNGCSIRIYNLVELIPFMA